MSRPSTRAILPFYTVLVVAILAFPALGQEAVLRDGEPVDSVIADLRAYIPHRMAADGIPGLTVALIRDGRIAWTEGFGSANRLTGRPMTPEAVFQVASISKVVTAYAALRLVEQGRLALDEPVVTSLMEPWLLPSEYSDRITLRQLLSHSSGLTDNLFPVDKSATFEPGSGFLYSGVGYLYLQAIVEELAGKRLEEAAQGLVFEPLGMGSSSFVSGLGLRPNMANGHMVYALPLLLFVVPLVLLMVVTLLAALLVQRLLVGRWRMGKWMWIGLATAVVVLLILLQARSVGRALPNMMLLSLLCGVGYCTLLVLAVLVGRWLVTRLPAVQGRPAMRSGLLTAWIVFSALVLFMLIGRLTGPTPQLLTPQPSAVGSLRSSANDLAKLLIELAQPRYLSEDLAGQLRWIQTPINENFSWGLGMGIQHSEQGNALWQNGITFGYRSLMVIYPERGLGAVVLTNSERGLPAASDIIHSALGGKGIWKHF